MGWGSFEAIFVVPLGLGAGLAIVAPAPTFSSQITKNSFYLVASSSRVRVYYIPYMCVHAHVLFVFVCKDGLEYRQAHTCVEVRGQPCLSLLRYYPPLRQGLSLAGGLNHSQLHQLAGKPGAHHPHLQRGVTHHAAIASGYYHGHSGDGAQVTQQSLHWLNYLLSFHF